VLNRADLQMLSLENISHIGRLDVLIYLLS
jgi:hypothetical protein